MGNKEWMATLLESHMEWQVRRRVGDPTTSSTVGQQVKFPGVGEGTGGHGEGGGSLVYAGEYQNMGQGKARVLCLSPL